jgi:hypothetical protein
MEIMGVLRVIATAALATAWIALAAAASLVAEVGADPPIRQVPLKRRELVNTPEQRHLLKYLVSCSLPRGVEAYVDDDGERHTFPGSLGLAPAWAERGLTETEQRWVSACILARTNAFGKSVRISMRAAEPAPPSLQASETERAAFNLFEGAFFGNIFAEKPVGYVCRGARAGQESRVLSSLIESVRSPPERYRRQANPLAVAASSTWGLAIELARLPRAGPVTAK